MAYWGDFGYGGYGGYGLGGYGGWGYGGWYWTPLSWERPPAQSTDVHLATEACQQLKDPFIEIVSCFADLYAGVEWIWKQALNSNPRMMGFQSG